MNPFILLLLLGVSAILSGLQLDYNTKRGYCAYAIVINGEKVAINPKKIEIRKGKLYLFYNSWGINALEL